MKLCGITDPPDLVYPQSYISLHSRCTRGLWKTLSSSLRWLIPRPDTPSHRTFMFRIPSPLPAFFYPGMCMLISFRSVKEILFTRAFRLVFSVACTLFRLAVQRPNTRQQLFKHLPQFRVEVFAVL